MNIVLMQTAQLVNSWINQDVSGAFEASAFNADTGAAAHLGFEQFPSCCGPPWQHGSQNFSQYLQSQQGAKTVSKRRAVYLADLLTSSPSSCWRKHAGFGGPKYRPISCTVVCTHDQDTVSISSHFSYGSGSPVQGRSCHSCVTHLGRERRLCPEAVIAYYCSTEYCHTYFTDAKRHRLSSKRSERTWLCTEHPPPCTLHPPCPPCMHLARLGPVSQSNPRPKDSK